jgi:hypothetical protein
MKKLFYGLAALLTLFVLFVFELFGVDTSPGYGEDEK